MAFAALLLAAMAGAASMVPIKGDPVQTASGAIAGTRLPSGVRAYLGVPYAQPPVRELRWRPPQPIKWDGIFNADRKGPECIQTLRGHMTNHYFGEEATSEDCLNLNIWVPADARPRAGLPVIVFIFGGGGTIGSASMGNYDGEQVARHGAIYVAMNYRVGALGFLAHPELTKEQGGHSGNYGFMDQTLALKWVHDNVVAFGGDPAKTIVMGQSFGASSVVAQLFSPMSKGLYRGAVMSSGCSIAPGGASLADGEKVGLELQSLLKASSLNDMRQVSADRILAVQAQTGLTRTFAVIDGYFWPEARDKMLADHTYNDVPMIAGYNHEDNDPTGLSQVKTAAEFHDRAVRMYGAEAAAEFERMYSVTDANAHEVAANAGRDAGMESNAYRCGELKAEFGEGPVYIDMFTHHHTYAPGVKIVDLVPATAGAYHNADIAYWFDSLDRYNSIRPTRAWTAYDRELADKMLGALIAFANTGSPSTPQVPWPAWSKVDPQEVVFGDTIELRKLPADRMDWFARHPFQRSPAAPARPGPRD